MDTSFLLLVGALSLLVIAWRVAQRLRRPKPPYAKRPSLLTAGELRFYRVLLQAVPAGVSVFVKVRLTDVVGVPDSQWATHGAKGSGMHLDFVLADASSLAPLLAIELDDKSHDRLEAKERDAFKDRALAAAGVSLLRVRAAARYDLRQLRAMLG